MQSEKLFHKDFILVVLGQIVSLFGNAILRFALPLYLLRTTGSAKLFGLVTACSFLPMIVLSLLGGVLADRVNKRNIMVGLDFATAIIMILFYLVLGQLPVVPLFIVALMLLYGISGTYQPAVQASIPLLASGSNILAANATINQISALASLLGPVLGGVFYSAWGIGPILIISIVCFFLSAVMELFIHIPHTPRKDQRGMWAIVKHDLGESFHFMKTEKPVFLKVIGLVAVFNLVLSAMIMVGIPVLIVETLQLSDKLLGIAQGALAFGGLAGGILTATLIKRWPLHKSYLLLFLCAVAIAVIGIALLFSSQVMFSYLVIVVMSFLAMIVSTIFTVQLLSVVQVQTPPHLVGKVIACIMAIAMCAQPLGQAVYGYLFDFFAADTWGILLVAALIGSIVALSSKKVFLELEQD